jgi:hypothetical protein
MTLHTARFPMRCIGTAGPSLPSSQRALKPDVIVPQPCPLNLIAALDPLAGKLSRISRIRERNREAVMP